VGTCLSSAWQKKTRYRCRLRRHSPSVRSSLRARGAFHGSDNAEGPILSPSKCNVRLLPSTHLRPLSVAFTTDHYRDQM
jgi:hypothetical protein